MRARRAPLVRASLPLLTVAAVAAVLLVACDPGRPTARPGSSGVLPPGSTASLIPPTTAGPPPSPTPPDSATAVVLDSTLLEILPADIDGVPVEESLDEAATALANPAVGRFASAVDAAVAVDTARGNLVYAVIARLRPDTLTAGTYLQWRDSYDDGACAAAGGIVGRAEAQIDARTVYVTSCVAGLRTYHLWLDEQDILISASSVGEDRFGEKLMDGLRVEE